MRVLIIEDDAISRMLLQKYLAPYGECHTVVNGKEATEAFHLSLERNQPYDLICLDIMMPEMDGQETLRNIRAIEKKGEISPTDKAKVIMTTVLTDDKNIMDAFAAGCDAYIVKPIDKDKLIEKIKELDLLE